MAGVALAYPDAIKATLTRESGTHTIDAYVLRSEGKVLYFASDAGTAAPTDVVRTISLTVDSGTLSLPYEYC